MLPVPERLRTAIQQDLQAKRREPFFQLPTFLEAKLLTILADPRDLPTAVLLVDIVTLVVPAAILVAYSRSHLFGALYCLLNYIVFLQRYLVALLHVTEHRQLFKKGLAGLSFVVPYLLGPLYGVPCGMYKLHHRVMHHVEGNHAPSDASSTELYARDSWAAFSRYWAVHSFGAWVSVPLYAWRKSRPGLLLECLAGEALYLGVLGFLTWWNPVASLWILLIPFLLTSLAIMFGNWSQHIFVDAQEPQNVFRLTYNCVGCRDNSLTFNDGYHILHHLNSRCHWSELPSRLLDTFELHTAEEAFIFAGVGFFDVGLMVMCGQLDKLAHHLVPCSPGMAAMSQEELVQLMKSRLQPLPASK